MDVPSCADLFLIDLRTALRHEILGTDLVTVDLPEEDHKQANEVDQEIADEDDAIGDARNDAPFSMVLVLLLQFCFLVANFLQNVADRSHLFHQWRHARSWEVVWNLLETPANIPAIADDWRRNWMCAASLFGSVVKETNLGEVDIRVGILAFSVSANPTCVPTFFVGGGSVVRFCYLRTQT